MLSIRIPTPFRIGDRATIRIGGHHTLTWRDETTIALDDTDTRQIYRYYLAGNSPTEVYQFFCTDAAGTPDAGPIEAEYVNPTRVAGRGRAAAGRRR